MPVERFFTEQEQISIGSHILVSGVELHHLAHVTRVSIGETVELVNGKGILANAVVENITKKSADLIVQQVETLPPVSREIILAQAIPRINRLDFILEKGTELGMSQLWLFPGKLSERKQLTSSQLEHMRAVTISAMKQCGRLYLPSIEIKKSLFEWKEVCGTALFGDLSEEAQPLKTIWDSVSKAPKVLFFVGPESGFTEEEEYLLRKMNVRGVKLHENILRTDTAAIVALSLLTQP